MSGRMNGLGRSDDDRRDYKSRYERAMDSAVVDNELMSEGSFTANYGKGLRLDLRAFLKESRLGKSVLDTLDPVERFVLLSYFLLRKTEKQIASLVGLNECRFNQFLENLIHRVGALVVFGNIDSEVWSSVLEKSGFGEIRTRIVAGSKLTKAINLEKSVRTVDVLVVFLRTRSFLKVGEQFGAYYVDLRRGLELVAEGLKKQKGLAEISLGEFIGSQVQFAGVQQEGYAGRMGKLPPLIKVKDPEVLGRLVVRIEDNEAEDVLIPRALGAI